METVLQNTIALAVVLLAFGMVIFVHEAGHFSIAKWVGIRVHEFALGFGPRLYGFRKGETEYNLRAFPFGGFVRMEGEDDPDSRPDDPGSFQNKTVGQQLAVLGGGVAMNYICAFIVLVCIGFARGVPTMEQAEPTSVVGDVVAGSVADKAGIRKKDRIVSVDGQPISTFKELLEKVQPSGGKELTLVVDRRGEMLTLKMTPLSEESGGKKVGRIGVKNQNVFKPVFTPVSNPSEVFVMAGTWLGRITMMPFELVKRVFITREMSATYARENMGGPIAIGQMFFEIYYEGFWAIAFFWAVISASVGGFNILPIPALDGARIFFVGLGAIRGRPIDPRKEGMVHMVGLVVLMTVMLLFSIQDVMRIFKGVKFFS